MNAFLNTPIIKTIFFSNFFYGLCTIALAIESSLQQKLPLNSLSFYLFLFFSTLFYYNLALSKIDENSKEDNPRLLWLLKHKKPLGLLQILYLLLFLFFAIDPFRLLYHKLPDLSPGELFLILLFPCTALLYYGINTSFLKTGNLRNIGWLKPFIIGFTWAGVVGVLPQLFVSWSKNTAYEPGSVSVLLFFKNFMFISVLCIMFDIKDYAKDYNFELKTFVVKFGLRKTIFFILIPLLVLGWVSFVAYGILNGFSIMRIFLNTLPFLLCIIVALKLKKRKSIYFYLVIIDGLMLIKALCGSLAIVYF